MIEFRGEEIVEGIKNALEDVLDSGAENIAAESKAQVPKMTGALENNCKIQRNSDLSVTVGYDLPYAVYQHEDLDIRHKRGKAKFLEEPFYAECDRVIDGAANAVGRVIK